MAVLRSSVRLVENRIDLSGLLDGPNPPVAGVNQSYRGVFFEDVITITEPDGSTTYSYVFGGTGFQYAGETVTGGRLTGFASLVNSGAGEVELWSLLGFDVPLLEAYRAIQTPSNNDDLAVLRSALAGDDLFELSNRSYSLSGYAGNDRMEGNGGDDTLLGGSGDDGLFGQKGDDWLHGEKGKDGLEGGKGKDLLRGGKGNDILNGGKGADNLHGDKGRDLLKGGKDAAADLFIFNKASDSPKGTTKRDKVLDFDRGEDFIDISGIDANSSKGGNQSFAFSEAGSAPNAVWVVDKGSNLLLRGDTDGDGRADFEIFLRGVATLGADDIVGIM